VFGLLEEDEEGDGRVGQCIEGETRLYGSLPRSTMEMKKKVLTIPSAMYQLLESINAKMKEVIDGMVYALVNQTSSHH